MNLKKSKKAFVRSVSMLLAVLTVWSSIGIMNIGIFADGDENRKGGSTLESYVKNLNLSGYVGENLIGNVNQWQIDACENNRGIIEQIAVASSGDQSLDSILGTDYFGVDGYFDINIKNNALGWTLKKTVSSYSDRDFKFGNQKGSVTDWSGADTLWVHIDASEVKSSSAVRIAFEENAVGRESYSLNVGASVYLWSNNTKTETKVENGGFVPLDEGFAGYIGLPLNTEVFSRYYNDGGNGVLDLSKVVQFQLSVRGNTNMVNSTLFMKEFIISGNVDGEKISGSDDTFKSVWTPGDLAPRLGYTGAIVIWYGEFVGKLLTGMAYSYNATGEEALREVAGDIIDELADAQGDDGYLGVFMGGARYSLSANNWDLWNQYHCIVGMLEWYKITGNKTALDTAKKCIDCIYETFKNRSYIVAGGIETNRAISHGYTMMYEITGDKKYLDEAVRITENDYKKNDVNGWYNKALKGLDFYTSSCSRWEVLHMVMTLGTLYRETGNEEYYTVMTNVWESVLKTDIHNSGGFTTNEGACGNPYAEGIVETCCTIAWCALTNEYLKYNKTVRVADELERSYFNGILGSLLDDDKYCTYNTPMNGIAGSSDLHGGVYDGRRVPSQKDISFQYNTGSPDMNCCQANIARGMGQISQWAALSGENELYINYYGECSIETMVDGKAVTVTQSTNYPLDGSVKLVISGLENDTEFTLKLRIPTWAYGSRVSYDGKTVKATAGEYYSIKKTWKNGDTVDLDLVLSFTYLTGERNQTGYASVFYGPILLTLDGYYAGVKNRTSKFTVTEIENAVISKGENGNWLSADVTLGDKTIRLVDFASAGKYNGKTIPSTYWSWINVTDAPKVKEGVTWLNSDRINIDFGEGIEYSAASAYVGSSVDFSVNIPEGYEIDRISSSVEYKNNEDGSYSFVMPDASPVISVSFKEKSNDTPPPDTTTQDTEAPEISTEPSTATTPDSASTKTPSQDDKSNNLIPIIGVAVGVLALITAAIIIIIKKKKK